MSDTQLLAETLQERLDEVESEYSEQEDIDTGLVLVLMLPLVAKNIGRGMMVWMLSCFIKHVFECCCI